VGRIVTGIAAVVLMLGLLVGGAAEAHQTHAVGPEGEYLVIFGFEKEPIYTEERNGLDLIVRRAADREPVAFLEETLFVEIVSPDGQVRRQLPVRARHGQPGYYTADIVLTQPGVYTVRVWGFIYDVQFDVEFQTHEVAPLAELRFP